MGPSNIAELCCPALRHLFLHEIFRIDSAFLMEQCHSLIVSRPERWVASLYSVKELPALLKQTSKDFMNARV